MVQPILYFTEDAKSAIRNALIQSIGNWIQYIVWRDKVTGYGINKTTFRVKDKHMFAINLLNSVGKDIIGWTFYRMTLPPKSDNDVIDKTCQKCDVVIREIIFSDNDIIGGEGHVDVTYECIACILVSEVKIVDKPLVDLVSVGSISNISDGRDIIHG